MDATGHSALELLNFSGETSPHPTCVTALGGLQTVFTNTRSVCFAVLIKCHFKLFLFLLLQQLQMGDELFPKHCAGDAVTQEWVN